MNCMVQVFAKPFVGAMNGHADGVSCMAKNPRRLNCLVSASLDGGNAGVAYYVCISLPCDHEESKLCGAQRMRERERATELLCSFLKTCSRSN